MGMVGYLVWEAHGVGMVGQARGMVGYLLWEAHGVVLSVGGAW